MRCLYFSRLPFAQLNRHVNLISRHGPYSVAFLSGSSSRGPKKDASSGAGDPSECEQTSVEKLKQRIKRLIVVPRAFLKGGLVFLKDCRKCFTILRADRGNFRYRLDRSHLPRSDLKVLRRVQMTFRHCGLLVTISLIPFIGYMALGALFFSRRLLTSYFWTEEQRVRFSQEDYIERRSFFNPFLDSLLSRKSFNWDVKSHNIMKKIAAGHCVPYRELQSVFFNKITFNALSKEQLYLLARCWQVWRVFPDMRYLMPESIIRRQLHRQLAIVQEDDVALVRDFHTLSQDDIAEACQFRGMKTQGVAAAVQASCLRNVCQISADSRDVSTTALASLLMAIKLDKHKAMPN